MDIEARMLETTVCGDTSDPIAAVDLMSQLGTLDIIEMKLAQIALDIFQVLWIQLGWYLIMIVRIVNLFLTVNMILELVYLPELLTGINRASDSSKG